MEHYDQYLVLAGQDLNTRQNTFVQLINQGEWIPFPELGQNEAGSKWVVRKQRTYFMTDEEGLALETMKYFCLNPGHQRVFSIWNHHKCLSQGFPASSYLC